MERFKDTNKGYNIGPGQYNVEKLTDISNVVKEIDSINVSFYSTTN